MARPVAPGQFQTRAATQVKERLHHCQYQSPASAVTANYRYMYLSQKSSFMWVAVRTLLLICTVVLPAGSGLTAQFYVSPAGNPNGSGSITSPWDLQTALNHPAIVQPGDTIWLRGGSYRHLPQGLSPGNGGYIFYSRLVGTAANPIIVRGFPGERAILDGGAFGGPVYGPFASARPTVEILGAYTWFIDFEIASSSTESRLASDDSSFPSDITRSDGPYVHGTGIKLIGLIIHDLT